MIEMCEGDDPQSSSVAHRFLDAQIAEWILELDLPHVVVCTDPRSGAVCLQGPYPDALAAAVAAQAAEQLEARYPAPERMRFSVAALMEPGGAER